MARSRLSTASRMREGRITVFPRALASSGVTRSRAGRAISPPHRLATREGELAAVTRSNRLYAVGALVDGRECRAIALRCCAAPRFLDIAHPAYAPERRARPPRWHCPWEKALAIGGTAAKRAHGPPRRACESSRECDRSIAAAGSCSRIARDGLGEPLHRHQHALHIRDAR